MDETRIWVVIFAKPPNGALDPLFKVRRNTGVDMMYPNRTRDAMRLEVGDRVVAHYGGSRDSHYLAQHLVLAGCVTEKARYLQAADVQKYAALYSLTCTGFPGFSYKPSGEEGIIFYNWFDYPSDVGPLFRLSAGYRQPGRGDNFILLASGVRGFHEVDNWWNKVVSSHRQVSAPVETGAPRITSSERDKYPLRGLPFTYLDPTKPVADDEWEAARP